MSDVWFTHGGRAIGLTLVFALAAEHAANGGCPAGPLYSRRIQVHQVIVGLAHTWVFPLVTPAKEQSGTFLKKAASALFAAGL